MTDDAGGDSGDASGDREDGRDEPGEGGEGTVPPDRPREDDGPDNGGRPGDDERPDDERIEELRREVDELRATVDEVEGLDEELDGFREDIEERTVHRDELRDDLRRYVRRRVRRGHARGWGPYLVLLYGTVMTIGAFRFESGGWAILAMLVIWLSTLGLYALMLIVGFVLALTGKPGRLADRIRDWRG